MHYMEGCIDSVQEGRFRLAGADGRFALFQLSSAASLEPQDLPPIMAAGRTVRVHYTELRQRGAALAHDLTLGEDEPGGGRPPRYLTEEA